MVDRLTKRTSQTSLRWQSEYRQTVVATRLPQFLQSDPLTSSGRREKCLIFDLAAISSKSPSLSTSRLPRSLLARIASVLPSADYRALQDPPPTLSRPHSLFFPLSKLPHSLISLELSRPPLAPGMDRKATNGYVQAQLSVLHSLSSLWSSPR
jgi:hypothetical protein